MTPPTSSPTGATIIDASVAVTIVANEAGEPKATAAINRCLAAGSEFFAPGVLVSETLYVLCGKLHDGTLSAADHAQAVQDFYDFLGFVLPPPNGERSLVLRAEAIRGSYTCRRSADGIYIALAEELTAMKPTELLTFDEDMVKQAAKHAPTVSVQLLVP
jgi:predicted nucleic acid-binding protein